MAEKQPDRRVRRTKRRLKQALLELIEERDYDRITIEDLTLRADVGRSTFYSHYASKEDLLFAGFDTWLLSLAESVPDLGEASEQQGSFPRFRFSLPLLRHIRSQKRFFLATFHQSSDPRIRRKIVALMVEPVKVELERLSGGRGDKPEGVPVSVVDSELSREAGARAVVGAFLELVSWWLSEADGLCPETVNELFQENIRQRPAR